MKFDTKVVRAGIEPDPTTGATIPPIWETATYVLDRSLAAPTGPATAAPVSASPTRISGESRR